MLIAYALRETLAETLKHRPTQLVLLAIALLVLFGTVGGLAGASAVSGVLLQGSLVGMLGLSALIALRVWRKFT